MYLSLRASAKQQSQTLFNDLSLYTAKAETQPLIYSVINGLVIIQQVETSGGTGHIILARSTISKPKKMNWEMTRQNVNFKPLKHKLSAFMKAPLR